MKTNSANAPEEKISIFTKIGKIFAKENQKYEKVENENNEKVGTFVTETEKIEKIEKEEKNNSEKINVCEEKKELNQI